jgi:hypothetical protein
MTLPSVAQMEAFIRREAARLGIAPDVAVRVARSEGLRANTWQSDLQQPYGRERSYGPFQLHVDPTGKRPGLGNEFIAETGLDPADPANWEASTMFALKRAAQGGWGPWMGAIKAGITGKMGIGGQPALPPAAQPPGLLDGGVREDRGGPYNSGYGAAAPVSLGAPSQQDFSVSPSQQPGEMDWAALAQMGQQVMEKGQQEEEQPQQMQWLQPQVLAPLRRVQLGKGLLG